MAALPNIPQDVILANQKALERCKVLKESPEFAWFIEILGRRLQATVKELALNQADKLTPNDCVALRGQLGLLMELADNDGNCPMLDGIAASAKLLQAPE